MSLSILNTSSSYQHNISHKIQQHWLLNLGFDCMSHRNWDWHSWDNHKHCREYKSHWVGRNPKHIENSYWTGSSSSSIKHCIGHIGFPLEYNSMGIHKCCCLEAQGKAHRFRTNWWHYNANNKKLGNPHRSLQQGIDFLGKCILQVSGPQDSHRKCCRNWEWK